MAVAVEIRRSNGKDGRPLRFRGERHGLKMITAIEKEHRSEGGGANLGGVDVEAVEQIVHGSGAESRMSGKELREERGGLGESGQGAARNDRAHFRGVLSLDQIHHAAPADVTIIKSGWLAETGMEGRVEPPIAGAKLEADTPD